MKNNNRLIFSICCDNSIKLVCGINKENGRDYYDLSKRAEFHKPRVRV